MKPEPPPVRSKAPSLSELGSALVDKHGLDSDPPAVRWLDRRIGHYVRHAVVAAVGSAIGWLAHHYAFLHHWMTP